MKPSRADGSGDKREAKLHRRDWLLLPAIGLFTMFVLAGSTELVSRWLFPVSQAGLENCFAMDDLSGDAPVRPNSVCSERSPESKLTAEYRFNSLGHRAGEDLRAKSPQIYRIVMIGSSIAMGLFVPREMTFAALLPEELSRQTGRRIELYNEATGGRFRGGSFPISSSSLRFKQVLDASPNMILWIVTPNDIVNASLDAPSPALPGADRTGDFARKRSGPLTSLCETVREAILHGAFAERLRYRWERSGTSFMLNRLLLTSESRSQYVTSYLKNEDDAGFLRAEPNLKWRGLLRNFQVDAAEFERQANAAGVPFVTVLVPNRAQATMISMDEWPQGYDPYKLDDELRDFIVSHGGIYIDILPDFRQTPNTERYYFPVDGHLDAEGHAIIARFLAKELASCVMPQTPTCRPISKDNRASSTMLDVKGITGDGASMLVGRNGSNERHRS